MKATIVLIASDETENFARKLMLDAHKKGDLGFEMSRLPHHVSLKQPFDIRNLDEIEDYFDGLASTLKPVSIKLLQVELWKSNVFGYDSGVMVIKAEKSNELYELHKRLNKELHERFGDCSADFDGDEYTFHMTFAIGGAPYTNYQRAYELLEKKVIDEEVIFSKLGLFYYDDNDIKAGTYFCYKQLSL